MGGSGAPTRALRFAAALLIWLLIALPCAAPELARVEQSLILDSPAPFESMERSFRTFAIPRDARPGPLPFVFRLAYPKDWRSGAGEAQAPLAVFIDDRKATWLIEEPEFGPLRRRVDFAYIREPASESIFVVCAEGRSCGRVKLIRNDLRARLALAGTNPGPAGRALAEAAAQAIALGLLVWLVFRTGPSRLLWILLGVEIATASSRWWVQSEDATRMAIGAGVLALALRPLREVCRWVVATIRRAINEEASPVSSLQVFVFLGVAIVCAWPGIRTTLGWYPSDQDDSHFYLMAAARFLRTGDFLHAMFEPDNWRYSLYPFMLAVLSSFTGLHPMDVYPWVSALGAIALVSSAGAVAWMITGRLSTGLLATWISGTWGGLGGWSWLLTRAPQAIATGGLRFLDTDYHESRFFGEFTGPYSEIASYISSAPLYPREAGLIPFWFGLALLYRRLRPGRPGPSLAVAGALFLASAAIYPYYGLTAPLALLVAAVAEGSGDEAMRSRRRRTLLAGAGLCIPLVVIGDLASRSYRGVSVWEWVGMFLRSSSLAIEADKSMPSMDFSALRIFGGEFFFAIAFLGALVLRIRPPDALSGPQRRAVLVTLLLCIGHGLANESSAYLHRLLLNFRWFVSWRALLTPISAMVAALFIEELVARAKARPTVWLAALALIPSFSGFLWSYSATDYLAAERERTDGDGRGAMARTWADYRAFGRDFLGRVVIPEPLAIEEAPLGERASAAAAFGVFIVEAPDLFANEGALLPTGLGAPSGLNAVALLQDSARSARLRASGCCVVLASCGRYDIFVRKPPPTPSAAAPPR